MRDGKTPHPNPLPSEGRGNRSDGLVVYAVVLSVNAALLADTFTRTPHRLGSCGFGVL